MKKKQTKIKLPKGFTINPELNHKYDNEPYFLRKAEEAKKILEKHPIPEKILRKIGKS